MRILAIDTSCDESCVAIVDTEKWKLLADVVHTHLHKMKEYGGVVPEIASREHLKGLPFAITHALKSANMTYSDIDWIAVTNRPGLVGALLVGVSFAKALALRLRIPFTTINHLEGHLYSPLLASFEDVDLPAFPWLALVVSGGHTELHFVESKSESKKLGATLDDAAGEAFDKIGKLLGLPYPAGPAMDRLVAEGASDSDRTYFPFPIAKTPEHSFSFSGLKTAVSLKVAKLTQTTPLDERTRLRLAASAQEAILNALILRVQKAKTMYPHANVVVTGGVACNRRFREKLSHAYFPKPRHCTDNAAMIALVAALKQQQGKLTASSPSESVHPNAELAVV